ncbi:MAG: hypothetical protein M1826_001665 [Phylliscum demangeonii]|nr:MAG: hypothetical protein M1826_001665 [Phylliscum demangeonii]
MAEGRMSKPEKDFTKDADKQLPEAEELAKKGNVQGAIEKLLALEKQTRQASDLASTSRILTGIVTICKEVGDWARLKEQVLSLSKKHGQLKQAVTKMVQVVMAFLDDTPNLDTKLSVIEALRTIFVEVERARVTRILSNIKKAQGNLKEAADILCELQVETFGSMARREKTEFILDQVALCIENDDWAQAAILSRKISTKYFARKAKKTAQELEAEKKAQEKKEKEEEEEKEKEKEKEKKKDEKSDADEAGQAAKVEDDVTDLRLRYYEQQILLAKHDDNYLDACKHYRQKVDTEAIEENPQLLHDTLRHIIYFIILAPYDNEQSDLLQRIHRDPRNVQVPLEAQLLKLFTIPELMPWPQVAEKFGAHLCSTELFSADDPSSMMDPSTPASAERKEAGKRHQRWLDLRDRVIEHNIRVVARYYIRIRLDRLRDLLDLDAVETERHLSRLVTAKTVYARIDRPAGVVSFAKPRMPDDVLNEWSSDMKSLLGLLERIDHLITKEEMMGALRKTK